MKYLSNQDGWIKPVLTIAILLFLAYSGYQFGIPYYRHSAFKDETVAIARISQGDLKKVSEDVYAAAVESKIPIQENDIIVEKRGNKIHIKTSWSQTIDILGFYQKTVDFDVDVEE